MAQEAGRSVPAPRTAGGEPIHVAAQHGDRVALADCLSSGVSPVRVCVPCTVWLVDLAMHRWHSIVELPIEIRSVLVGAGICQHSKQAPAYSAHARG